MLPGPPRLYWPIVPSVRTTRWQGTISGTGLWPKRGPDSAHRLRPADLGRDPAVWPDLAPRDLQRLRPDGHLELGPAAEVQGDADPPLPGEAPRDGVQTGAGAATWRRTSGGRCARRGAARPRGRRAPAPPRTRRARSRRPRASPAGSRWAPSGRRARSRRGRRRRAWAGLRTAIVREAARRVVGEGSEIRAVHAVCSSSSVPAAAARSIASPRETWAFSVPSGRPSTSDSSA